MPDVKHGAGVEVVLSWQGVVAQKKVYCNAKLEATKLKLGIGGALHHTVLHKTQHWVTCTATETEMLAGFAQLNLHNNVYHSRQMVNDFFCSSQYCRAWCWGSNCGLQARCCRPQNPGLKLECRAGTRAYGAKDRWGPYSVCAVGFTAVTSRRINLLDHVHPNRENLAKQQCNENGCRSWCWGSACETWAQCCRVVPR